MLLLSGSVVVEGGDETPYTDPFVPDVQPLSWRWSSWTGQEWLLTDTGGPVTKMKGATGLDMPQVTHVYDEGPNEDGAVWQSTRTPSRDIFLPVLVHASDSPSMRTARRDFLRTLNPARLNTLSVTSYDADTRYLDLRYVNGGDAPIDLDPQAACRIAYPLALSAEKPYWRGDILEYGYQPETPIDTFPGPPFNLAANKSLNSQTVTNPGDIDAWPVWTVYGPFTSFTVGVGSGLTSSTVSVTATKLVGEYVTIDMTPGARRVTGQTGANMLGSVTSATFAPIPAGVDSQLDMAIAGSGIGTSISLKFTPLYWCGW